MSRRKIYDLVLVDTELDWLEIRMHELQHQVDYFVILEATSTFTRKPKPLHVKSNFDRFRDFHPKIIYHTLNLDHIKDSIAWERESYCRNSLFDAVFPFLRGPAAPELGDVILVSDSDEIPSRSAVTTLRNCQFPERTTLRSQFFYYSFQWRHVGEDWHHPQATFYQGLNRTLKPEDLRMSHNGVAWDLRNAGWHCSWCFSTVAEMIHKIESWSHADESAEPQLKDPSEIARRIRNGLDILGREWERNERVDSMNDIPQYLKESRGKFEYLLDRDPVNANLRDYL
jgi:beta-1,4-mannosyl-glycoprotein beta-1,4-N-acetylglucosaminyltransferase